MKISDIVQMLSAKEKSLNGILKIPSEPNIIPKNMKSKSTGTPSFEETLLSDRQIIIITAIISMYKDIKSPFKNKRHSKEYNVFVVPESIYLL